MTKKLVSFDDQAEPGQGLPAAVKAELSATYGTRAEVEQALPRSLSPVMPVEVDITEAFALTSETPVDLTTYVGGNNAIVHPSVLFFDEGWNGWRYWMAYTPYNNANIDYENPCIAVSNDGESWTVPAGLTNPVEPRPTSGGTPIGYNADPVLCMTPDGSTMLMVWKRATDRRQLCLRTTTDGVAWTPRQVILDNTYEDVSPALLWDNGQYRMWTVVTDPAQVPTPTMFVRTADDPAGPWSAPVACTVTGMSGTVNLWHMDIKRVGQEYHCVFNTGTDPGYGQFLWFGRSADGLNWEFAPHTVMRQGMKTQQGYYKAAILPKMSPTGLVYDMWYSGTGDFRMYKTTIRFDRSRQRDARLLRMLSIRDSLTPVALYDDFNRPDRTDNLGVATTGQTWAHAMGPTFGVAGGFAYVTATGGSRTTIDPGKTNIRVGADFPVIGTEAWIMFRYQDASNLWRFGYNSSGLSQIQAIVGGTIDYYVTEGGLFSRIVDGDRIEVEDVGNRIRMFLNGRQIFEVTDSRLKGATKVGLNCGDTAARIKHFLVESL